MSLARSGRKSGLHLVRLFCLEVGEDLGSGDRHCGKWIGVGDQGKGERKGMAKGRLTSKGYSDNPARIYSTSGQTADEILLSCGSPVLETPDFQ